MNYYQSNFNKTKESTWNNNNSKNSKMVGYSTNIVHQTPLTKFFPYSNNQQYHQNETEKEFFVIENNNNTNNFIQQSNNNPTTSYSGNPHVLQNSFNQTQKSVNIFSQLSNFHNSGQVVNSLEQLQLNTNKRPLENDNELNCVKIPRSNSFVRSITTQHQNAFNNKLPSNEIHILRQNKDNLTDHSNKNEIKAKIADNQKLRIITGNVENTIKTIKSFPNITAFFEVFAQVISKRSGKYDSEQILLLRNASGPVLQGFFYEIDFKLINFNIGNYVRCVGRFTGQQRFQILKITPCTNYPPDLVSRMHTMCNLMLIKDRDKDRI